MSTGGGTLRNLLSHLLDLPTAYALFAFLVAQSQNITFRNVDIPVLCRKLSGNIYYIHMYFVAFCALIWMGEDGYRNFYSFAFVSITSCILGIAMLYFRKKKMQKGRLEC